MKKQKEAFDWYAKKREIAKHSFKPRPNFLWLWTVAIVWLVVVLSFFYFHESIVSPWLEQKVQAAEMTDEEICANLDRFSNG